MSKERLEEIQNEVNYAYRRNGSISTKAVTMPIEHYEHLYEQAELVEELEQQNKRYREAREILEQVYKDSYFRNAYGYEGGYLGGLDTAMDIIDKELEESE